MPPTINVNKLDVMTIYYKLSIKLSRYNASQEMTFKTNLKGV